jgi:glycosyltransferase involved in cell wall biosynthesis
VKKVLILSYYWPPSGGAGVQRWLKFVKYLRHYGWEPIVYTAQNGEYPIIDESFFKDIPEGITVIKQPIWEPYQLYKKVIGQKKEERVVSGFLNEGGKKGLGQKLSLWLRGNVFVPDARCFWIKPSIKYLNHWLEHNHVDALVSTGPPHSMHLIARGLKRKTAIKWLADFRDPWVNIDFAGDIAMGNRAKRLNTKLEKSVLDEADQVVVVSELMAEEFRTKTSTSVEVITNGYDPDDFKISDDLIRKDGNFNLVHTGSLNDRRNHPVLWKAIADLRNENQEFKNLFRLRLIGKNDASVRRSIEETGLSECCEFIDYLPHEKIIAEQKSASVLLLSINNYGSAENGFFSPKATLTGKLFEYLAAEKPILMVGPNNGQAAEVVAGDILNRVVGFEDAHGMKQALLELFNNRELNKQSSSTTHYSRKELTREISDLLNRML